MWMLGCETFYVKAQYSYVGLITIDNCLPKAPIEFENYQNNAITGFLFTVWTLWRKRMGTWLDFSLFGIVIEINGRK